MFVILHFNCRWDFAQNYVHKRSSEVHGEHFGKDQTQMLVAVVWHHAENSTPAHRILQKSYYVFASTYLIHSSLLFQKCYDMFRENLLAKLPFQLKKEIILTDSFSQQFKNRNNLHWTSCRNQRTSTSLFSIFIFLHLHIKHLEVAQYWLYDPPYHGKGPCDSHTSTIKSVADWYLLDIMFFLKKYIVNVYII